MISVTGSFFYYIAVNPVIQAKAQREIDGVVGRNRLPDFSDRPTMPYVEAIYREVLRCRPPVQMGIPHCLMEDDCYKDYFIPKGWWSSSPKSHIIAHKAASILWQ
jgi:cytochrome P450